MRVEGIGGQLIPRTVESVKSQPAGGGFGETIKSALSGVNDLQVKADAIAGQLAVGDPVEVHQAMIAMQKASMSLQFTIQVRNKVVEAYQEIMRMQV
jgi:flagellar hook-basal body complex protein FliE